MSVSAEKKLLRRTVLRQRRELSSSQQEEAAAAVAGRLCPLAEKLFAGRRKATRSAQYS